MRCAEFERHLQEALDERTLDRSTPENLLPQDMQVHCRDCKPCWHLLLGYRQLLVGLANRNQPAPPAMLERVLDNVARPSKRSRWLLPLATAASIAIAITLAMVTRHQATVATQLPMAASPADGAPVMSDEQTPSPSGLDEARARLDEDSLDVVFNLAGLSPVTFSAEVLEAHLASQPQWMASMADELKPVTETMSGTLNALWQVLPQSTEPEVQDAGRGASFDRYRSYDRLS
jgi:hypothetical protein